MFKQSAVLIKLLIHGSLHLFLYSKIRDIYSKKFKFQNTKYIGNKLVLQLDEGFAELLTEVIVNGFDTISIKDLPLWSELNELPTYKKEVEKLNINKLNSEFNKIYNINSKKGYHQLKKEYFKIKDKSKKAIFFSLIKYINQELSKHK